MTNCDVLVAGGGPAGSTCAWALVRAGFDVVVIDRAAFPRDKVCAGWITPQVIAGLGLDIDAYRRGGRTCQSISGFRTALIGGRSTVVTDYEYPVSFGIRRCEFDEYLLRRSGARLELGVPLASIRRSGGQWVVNDQVSAPVLVGAGGHFCPVSRWVNGTDAATADASLVAAQEMEFALTEDEESECQVEGARPEIYFSLDFRGYGWCFRKGRYLNVGLGRADRRRLPEATRAFAEFLRVSRHVPERPSLRWQGHAYRLNTASTSSRRVLDDGVLLVGDSAGLAYRQSGEGIRPAIESGLLAARAIVEAGGRYTRERLAPYEQWVGERLGAGGHEVSLTGLLPDRLMARLGRSLLAVPLFVRSVVLDRWFLHAAEPAIAWTTEQLPALRRIRA